MPPLNGYRRAMGRVIAERIKQLRIARGLNQTELAERLAVTQATVSRWERGSTPDADKLAKLAEMAGLSIEQFIRNMVEGERDSGLLNRFSVKGAVQAGDWALAQEWPEEEWRTYSGGAHINAPDGKRYGLEVRGDSMNEVYPMGTILDCVSIFDLTDVANGQRVIVERERLDGYVEATVKEYHRDEQGKEWLVPRSKNPGFQTPIDVANPGPDIAEIRVVARVVGSYRPE